MKNLQRLRPVKFQQVEIRQDGEAVYSIYVKVDGVWRRITQRGVIVNGRLRPTESPQQT